MKGFIYCISYAVSILAFCALGAGCNPEVNVTAMGYPAAPPTVTTEYQDNTQLFFAIQNLTTDPNNVTLLFKVGNDKAGTQTVSTPIQPDGSRAAFVAARLPLRPLNDTSQVSIFYCMPGDAACANPAQAGGTYQVNQPLSRSMKVAAVWFHELRANNNPSNRSTYSAEAARRLVDSAEYNDDFKTATSADVIYAQCATSSRWQFRFHRSDVIDVAPSLLDVVENPNVPLSLYEALADALDPPQQYLHVFWVNSFTGRDGSQLGGYADDFNNVILLVDYYTPLKTAAVLAHEYGHIQGLGHLAESDASCGAGENYSNLMCVGVWGRALNNAQCQTMFSNGAHLLDLF